MAVTTEPTNIKRIGNTTNNSIVVHYKTLKISTVATSGE